MERGSWTKIKAMAELAWESKNHKDRMRGDVLKLCQGRHQEEFLHGKGGQALEVPREVWICVPIPGGGNSDMDLGEDPQLTRH